MGLGGRQEGKERKLGKGAEAGIIECPHHKEPRGHLLRCPLFKGRDWPEAAQQVCEIGTPDGPRPPPPASLEVNQGQSLSAHTSPLPHSSDTEDKDRE